MTVLARAVRRPISSTGRLRHSPATPSNPYRQMKDLTVALKRAGLLVSPPSKKEQRAQRRKEQEK